MMRRIVIVFGLVPIAAQGQTPAAAAANAITNATGVRMRDIPIRPEPIKTATGV